MKKSYLFYLSAFFIILLNACVEKSSFPSPLQGLLINHIYLNADQTSHTISLSTDLSHNVLWEATDSATNQKASWVKSIKFSKDKMEIQVEENITIYDRCAHVILSIDQENSNYDDADLKVYFNIVQAKNNIFDGLNIDVVVMPHSAHDTLIGLSTPLKDVKIEAKSLNGENASWCKPALLSSQLLRIHADEYKSTGIRQALVRLLPANKNNVVAEDSLVNKMAILVTQQQNPVFENFPTDTLISLTWDQQGDTLLFTPIKGIKCIMTDSATHATPTWLQTTIDEKNNRVVLKPQVNNMKTGRKATVTLYLPKESNSTAIDSTVIHTTFIVRQQPNDIFNDADLGHRILRWNQTVDTIKPNFDITSVRYALIDTITQEVPSWLKLSKEGKALIVKDIKKLTSNEDRSVKVTLYMGSSEKIDSTNAQVSFVITQCHNDIFDTLQIAKRKLAWDQKTDTLKFKQPLTEVKSQVIDNATHNTASWLKAEVKEDYVAFTPTVHKSKSDRSATVTLYIPNGNAIDDKTVKTSFVIEQQHNGIFDNAVIEDRTIEHNQTADTLRMDTELKDIRCQLIDNETMQGATWVSGKVSGKEVIFNSKVNNAINSRSATVTLYLLDGNNVETSTVKTSFKLTQNYRTQVKVDEKKVEVDHTAQSVDLHVSSNTKYQVETPGEWVRYVLTPIDEINEIITLNFTENKTSEKHTGDLKILVSGEEVAKVSLTQLTNPRIEINFEDERTRMGLAKEGGEFNLPIKTLTPDYKISKNSSWVSVGSAITEGTDQYYHKITVPYFTGDAFERVDTLVISNFKETVRFPIKQHKYIYLNEARHEVEEGDAFSLIAKTNTNRSIIWTSGNTSVAQVSNTGYVQAVDRYTRERGLNSKAPTVRIKASIGDYEGVEDYHDYCDVTVFIAPDKVDVARGGGDYQKIDDKVTSFCPIVITNNYSKSITMSSLGIEGVTDINVKNSEEEYIKIKNGNSYTFSLPMKLENVYKPVIVLSFTVNDKTYTKKVYY
jgi:hypothetical protein